MMAISWEALIPANARKLFDWEDLLFYWREDGRTDAQIRADIARWDWPRIIAEREAYLRGNRPNSYAYFYKGEHRAPGDAPYPILEMQ